MSWRVVVISSRSKLELKLGYLVVRGVDGTKRIHLKEIGVLIIESTGISLTASLFCIPGMKRLRRELQLEDSAD